MADIIKRLESKLFNKVKIYNIIFVLILVVGFFLRLKLFIYNPSLCKDEAGLALYMIKAQSYLSLFTLSPDIPMAPPLFLVLAKFFYSFFDVKTISPVVSDYMLRVVPFISGVLLIPTFGVLVYKIFKNRFITSMGMLFVALYPLCITFSVYFRQYSSECLVTVVLMLITLSVDLKKDSWEKSLLKFGMLSVMPLFSLVSLIILPFSILYLFVNSIQDKTVNKYLLYTSLLVYIQILYYFIFLYGVIFAGNKDFVNFGLIKPYVNYIYAMYISLCCVLFSKNLKKILLYGGPVLLTMILILFKQYPCVDCNLLFILPLVVISLLFLFEFVSLKIFNRYKLIGAMAIIFVTVVLLLISPAASEYRYKEEYGREIWSVLMHTYKVKSKKPILFGGSYKTNAYYNYIYNVDYIKGKDVLNDKNWANLPDGNHFFIITNMNDAYPEYEFLRSRYDVRIFDMIFYNPKSCYIYFKKSSRLRPKKRRKIQNWVNRNANY